jgi:hypothetical protein
LTSCDLAAQRVESLVPEPSIGLQPAVHFLQRRGVDRVEPAGAGRPDAGESVVAKHPEMLGYRGLGDPELALDDVADLTGRLLVLGDQLDDASADRITEYVESVHVPDYIGKNLYK